MYFPTHHSEQRYLVVFKYHSKSRGPPQFENEPASWALAFLASQAWRSATWRPRNGSRSVRRGRPFSCCQGRSRDSLTLCRRRRTAASPSPPSRQPARPPASPPALSVGLTLPGPNLTQSALSFLINTRPRPHQHPNLSHSTLSPSYTSHSPCISVPSRIPMSLFTLP